MVAPDKVCPKCITGALKLKFGGIKGTLYPDGADRPGARPGAPAHCQYPKLNRKRVERIGGYLPCPYP